MRFDRIASVRRQVKKRRLEDVRNGAHKYARETRSGKNSTSALFHDRGRYHSVLQSIGIALIDFVSGNWREVSGSHQANAKFKA